MTRPASYWSDRLWDASSRRVEQQQARCPHRRTQLDAMVAGEQRLVCKDCGHLILRKTVRP